MQQINLLNGELLPKSDPLLVKHFVLAWAGFLVVLVGLTGWQGLSLWTLQSEMDLAQSQVDQLRQDNVQQQENSTEPEHLKLTVQALKARQMEQSQLVALLKTEQETIGFSDLLTALAHARVEGLWLDEIRIHQGAGRQVTIAGATTDPRFLPELLQNLSEQTSFEGQRFETLDMNYNDVDKLLEFSVASPNKGVSG